MIVGSGLAMLVKCLLFQGSDKFQNWGSPAFLNVIDGSTVELSSLLSALYARNVVKLVSSFVKRIYQCLLKIESRNKEGFYMIKL